ncbi:MAG: Hpt domain-containing protein [Nitrospiraceae bacterium]
MAGNGSQDEFQAEVMALFAQEAGEWLGQVRTALQELEGGPNPARDPKLFEVMDRALTNLVGSAATVELPVIERLTLSLLELVQTLRGKGIGSSPEQVAALHAGLDSLAASIQNLPVPTAVGLPDEPTMAAPASSPNGQESADVAAVPTILDALLDLKRCRAILGEPARPVLETVIRRLQGNSNGNPARLDHDHVARLLEEMDRLDEQFLVEMQQLWPTISEIFSGLKLGDAVEANGHLQLLLQQTQCLCETASAVEATAIVSFLKGFEKFVTIAAHRRVALLPQRYEAVGSRLAAMLPMVHQWVELGRTERQSIQQILASLVPPPSS